MLPGESHLTQNRFVPHINNGEHRERVVASPCEFLKLCTSFWTVGGANNTTFVCVVCRLSGTGHSLASQSGLDSSSSEEFYQAVHHAEQTFRKMESYLKQQQLCDVILIVGNRKIPAHRYSNLSVLGLWICVLKMIVWDVDCKMSWLEN